MERNSLCNTSGCSVFPFSVPGAGSVCPRAPHKGHISRGKNAFPVLTQHRTAKHALKGSISLVRPLLPVGVPRSMTRYARGAYALHVRNGLEKLAKVCNRAFFFWLGRVSALRVDRHFVLSALDTLAISLRSMSLGRQAKFYRELRYRSDLGRKPQLPRMFQARHFFRK